MDRQKEERARGVTIACTTKEFFTDSFHYTIIDAPGHRDFIKNMISGAAQADVALLMVPADGNFPISIQKGNHKQGEIQGQTRQHSRLLNLLGVKQLIVGVNKMDAPSTAEYKESRFIEIRDEMREMLKRTGWSKDFVDNCVPVLPISGYNGDNLIEKSTKMPWWKGVTVKNAQGKEVLCHTLYDALEMYASLPKRKSDFPMRLPVAGIYSIKGVGDVLAGRVEQGVVHAKKDVVFLPTHSSSLPCGGKLFSIEMHHKRVETGFTGDNVGLNVKGLEKKNMPRVGDVMIYKEDTSLLPCKSFTAQIQTLDIPGELKPGYSPIAFVRCGHSACKLKSITWKIGKETGKSKVENPPFLKANEAAECVFEPLKRFVVDTFEKCEGLSRIAFLDGNTAVMLGKVVQVEYAAKD
ncbi:hypothetical protein HMI54_000891 [Coelomomyces lativittatus]|nr:hypothetical protein HMI56_006744 [Coelomomyces lativittatus]KAJ1511337.1 hypothetical protein HMI54_000891 [Coelomomyces lativittatus]